MKTHTLRIASTILTLAMLVTSGLVVAQQPAPREQQLVQKEELQIPALIAQQEDSNTLRVALPRECARTRPVVQMHDVPDNFSSPGNPATLSPALTNFLSANNLSPKGYDDARVNKVFADSFKLGNCRVCYATLEVRVRHYQDAWTNDTLTAGVAPFSPASLRLLGTNIWPTGSTTYVLPANALSQLVFNNQLLDVVAQDDTDFDYMKLSVWYY